MMSNVNQTTGPLAIPQRMSRSAFVLLLLATLSVATAYGIFLLLPLYIKELGGNEASFGIVAAAAALPTAVVLGALLRFPRRVPPPTILALASLAYAAAAAGMAAIRSVGVGLVILGLVLGTVWAVVYTVAPIVVSDRVQDTDRAAYIGYVTGTIQVGFGLGPALGGWLHEAGWSYPAVLLVGAGLAAVGSALVMPIATASTPVDAAGTPAEPPTPMRLGPALGQIARSPAGTPLLMILLAACLFTVMNSFQTTFAQSRGLSFEIFYGTYTVGVIVARLALTRWLPDSGSDRALRLSTGGIVVAVVAFLLIGSNAFLYACASGLLGVTYGLALPALQARAVNLASADLRPFTLPLAGLLFQVTILSFPLVAGTVITTYGYRVLFAVLVALASVLALAALRSGARQELAARAARGTTVRL
jgi:MFS family permease